MNLRSYLRFVADHRGGIIRAMQIHEYQQWLEAWDKVRGWDRVSPSHTLIHAMEELGEVARLVLQWEGYKQAESAEQLHAELEDELSDVFVFLFKLAYQTGVDVEAALTRGQAKAEDRYPDLVQASAELARYHSRQAELARMVGVTEQA
jgi:NTP pyrophosphatase (non-canonical NTP hydrolase)